jgi:hypothetical protein
VAVGFRLFVGGDLFEMDVAIRLMVIDTQYTLAIGKFAFPAFEGGFQNFSHGYSFRGNFPHR